MPSEENKVVFLDRDGTINHDCGYVYRKEDWQFKPRAKEALHNLKAAGFKLALITNQSGIGHGLYTEADVEALHIYMQAELKKSGAELDVIAYCPHHREAGCECRKPEIGMARQIEEKIGKIDYAASWTIGDKEADLLFGKKLGTKTALIKSQYWQAEELSVQPDMIVESLDEAANKIMLS